MLLYPQKTRCRKHKTTTEFTIKTFSLSNGTHTRVVYPGYSSQVCIKLGKISEISFNFTDKTATWLLRRYFAKSFAAINWTSQAKDCQTYVAPSYVLTFTDCESGTQVTIRREATLFNLSSPSFDKAATKMLRLLGCAWRA